MTRYFPKHTRTHTHTHAHTHTRTHAHTHTHIHTRTHTAMSEREVLDKLMPELVQYTNPLILLPYLQRHRLVNPDDAERIIQPAKIDRERTQIIVDNVVKNPEGLHDFIQCLQEEPDHPGHSYLATRLRCAITDSNQQRKEKTFGTLWLWKCVTTHITCTILITWAFNSQLLA